VSETKPDALAVSQNPSHDICRVTSPETRESRGRAFAAEFVSVVTKGAAKFLRERESELRQIRQDFDDKPKTELICGVRTFTEYCENVMGYGIRQAQRILEGKNPALTDEENKAALNRKAKRELTAKTNRAQAALPIRSKTNAEILADKQEETKTEVLQKQVASLTHELESARQQPPVKTITDDLQKIHANEIQALETEIEKLKASNQKLTKAYAALRSEALRIATAAVHMNEAGHVRRLEHVLTLSQEFLVKHGEVVETVGGAL